MGQSFGWLKPAHAVTGLLSVVDLLYCKTLSLINLITYNIDTKDSFIVCIVLHNDIIM